MNEKIMSLFFLFVFVVSVSSQPSGSENPSELYITETNLLVEDGKAVESKQTNVKKFLLEGESGINDDGSMLVADNKLIKDLNQEPHSISLPVSRRGLRKPQFSLDGNFLTYWYFDEDPTIRVLQRYDLVKEATSDTHYFQKEKIALATYYKSPDASTIVSRVEISTVPYLHLYKRVGLDLEKTVYGPYGVLANIQISQAGDRVFFVKTRMEEQRIFAYVEKTPEGWTKEIEIPDPILKIQDEELTLVTVGIADNGRTRILKTWKNHYAVSHEMDGVWSEPEYVGFIDLNQTKTYETKTVHSEDGRVIVVEQPKVVSPDYGTMSWDVFVFLRDIKGQWSKHQINPPDVGALGDVLLSGNGQKLFWTPERPLSAIKSEVYE